MKFHRLCVAASRLLEGVNQMTKLSKQCLNCVRPRAACVVSSKVLIVFDADNPYYSFHKTLKKTKIFLIRITDRSSRSEVFCVWHRCFPVNFAKFLRTPSLIEHVFWLLLNRDVFRAQSIKVGAKTNNRLMSDVWVGSECTPVISVYGLEMEICGFFPFSFLSWKIMLQEQRNTPYYWPQKKRQKQSFYLIFMFQYMDWARESISIPPKIIVMCWFIV